MVLKFKEKEELFFGRSSTENVISFGFKLIVQ